METNATVTNAPIPRRPPAALPAWWGAAIAAAALLVVLAWLYSSLYGVLLLAGPVGGLAMLAAFRRPMLPVAAYWIVAPFNYGWFVAGGTLKIGEAIVGLMLVTILLRLAAECRATGAGPLWQRVRRGAPVLLALALLSVMAIATAAPHPNAFNVRYEIQNYIAMAYALLFFERRHWPLLVALFAAMLAVESAVALAVKYGFGLTGLSFAGVGGGVERVWLTADDLESLAGGLFRLSGTFGHKNLLAAYHVLLLPLAALELLRPARRSPGEGGPTVSSPRLRVSEVQTTSASPKSEIPNPKSVSIPYSAFRIPHFITASAVILPALVTLALTDSMTGWGATAVIVVLALIHLRRFDYLAVFCLLLAPVAAAALWHFGDSIFFRVEQLLGGGEAGYGTVSSRMEMLTISERLIAEHPWLGIGRNNFAAYGETYYIHAHNLFLMKLIETGVPAGLMFAALIAGVLARAWMTLLADAPRLAREGQYYRCLGLWLGCLGFTAMNMLDYSYANFSLGPLYMFMLGALPAVAWQES
jgi:hypothetical protein